jgi:hypothetical protein
VCALVPPKIGKLRSGVTVPLRGFAFRSGMKKEIQKKIIKLEL